MDVAHSTCRVDVPHGALIATDNNGTVCVVHDIIANATHDGTTYCAQPSRAHHYHGALLFLGNVGYHLTWFTTEYRLDLPSQLQTIRQLN